MNPDDFANTPPPNVSESPKTPNWPTPINHFTEASANLTCTTAITNLSFFEMCQANLSIDISGMIQSCVEDIKVFLSSVLLLFVTILSNPTNSILQALLKSM